MKTALNPGAWLAIFAVLGASFCASQNGVLAAEEFGAAQPGFRVTIELDAQTHGVAHDQDTV